MALPILTKPVKRPDLVDPTTCVDLEHGGTDVEGRPTEEIYNARNSLILGANYNDPAAFRYPEYHRVMSSAVMRSGSVTRWTR